jgi:multisubunit Na+/H+ antiporter MnhG subunit
LILLFLIGTVIEGARLQLGAAKLMTFAIFFALTTPVGVMIGILITDVNPKEDERSQTFTLGILICVYKCI